MKPLSIVLILALAACESAPKMPVQPEEPPQAQENAPQADSSESPPLGYWKSRIVEAANAEWVYFGQQTVVIDGDDESIPQWEFGRMTIMSTVTGSTSTGAQLASTG